MNFRMFLALIGAFVGLAALSAPASAATVAHTTTSLNVRSGPGAHYAKIATLPAGHRVELYHCEDSWCSIRAAGIHGWASASYLERSQVVRPVIVQPHIVIRPPHYRPHRPHWSHKPHRPRPPKPPRPHKPQCKIAPGFPCK
ncbi:SH3 type 3 domain protein [Mesorhizobium plurifarium]|uniref:SH3 type 3 domain protein n=1 Tax=Mesorhizobium plurifarium TaxID=69974 RepID=A0A090FZ00_MESPL|nr:SH3 type 3 domain protein [Mesorhizobium plurifarium]